MMIVKPVPAPSCPDINSLWVNVPSGAGPIVVGPPTAVHRQFDVNPIVTGSVGCSG